MKDEETITMVVIAMVVVQCSKRVVDNPVALSLLLLISIATLMDIVHMQEQHARTSALATRIQ